MGAGAKGTPLSVSVLVVFVETLMAEAIAF